jgi:hypothetical protein
VLISNTRLRTFTSGQIPACVSSRGFEEKIFKEGCHVPAKVRTGEILSDWIVNNVKPGPQVWVTSGVRVAKRACLIPRIVTPRFKLEGEPIFQGMSAGINFNHCDFSRGSHSGSENHCSDASRRYEPSETRPPFKKTKHLTQCSSCFSRSFRQCSPCFWDAASLPAEYVDTHLPDLVSASPLLCTCLSIGVHGRQPAYLMTQSVRVVRVRLYRTARRAGRSLPSALAPASRSAPAWRRRCADLVRKGADSGRLREASCESSAAAVPPRGTRQIILKSHYQFIFTGSGESCS